VFHFSTYRPSLFKHLSHPICQQASECLKHAVRYGTTSTATSPYLLFINDVTVTSSY